MTEFSKRAAVFVVFALLCGVGCTQDAADAKSGSGTSSGQPQRSTRAKPAGSISLASVAYTPSTGALLNLGRVSGTVQLTSATPVTVADNTQRICGTKPIPVTKDAGFANTVVWIADVKTGKPLPMVKRQELSSEDCVLDPRLQAAVVGTTFNVFNDDKMLHRLVFLDAATRDTLTVMPFFNVGQVVASEHLAKHSGIVEIHCVQHPWTRGYIAVFDSPYYDVTDAQGRFTIDSLPAGSYRVMAWREGMLKPLEQQVQVAANGDAKVEMKVPSGS